MPCASSEDADQPGHPLSQISPPGDLWIGKDQKLLHEDREDSDQIVRFALVYANVFFSVSADVRYGN